MDFPDDPGYQDTWADAQDLIEACGLKGAFQVALLETARICNIGVEEDFGFEDEELFLLEASDDTDTSGDQKMDGCQNRKGDLISSSMAAKVVSLVKLHQRAAMV